MKHQYNLNEGFCHRPTSTLSGSHAPSAFRLRLPQILANVAANLLVLDICMGIGFTTILIAATLNSTDDITINDEQASWLGSIAFICQPIGSLMSGFIVEFFGRKWSMILVNIPFLTGWLLYSFSNSVNMLFAANIVQGVGIGFMEAPLMTYLGETCQPDVRALITAFPGITCQLSFFIIYLMGNVMHWKTAAGISASLPVFTVLYMFMMPETPIWLLSRGRYKDAERSLCWLRGWVTPDLVREEFNQLVAYSNAVNKTNFPVTSVPVQDSQDQSKNKEEDNHNTNNTSGSYENKAFEPDSGSSGGNNNSAAPVHQDMDEEGGAHCSLERWKEMFRAPTLRPLGVILPCFLLLHWGGFTSIRPYMVHVFEEFGMGEAASWTTVGSGVIGVAGGLCLFILVHWVGKRRLSLVAMAGSAVSCLVIAVYSYLVTGPDGEMGHNIPWLPMIMVIALSFFNSLFFYIPWNLLCEVFPFRTRGIASGFSAAMCYVFMFVASKTYLDMEDSVHIYGAFFIFSAINVLGFLFVYWRVSVTEGKSLVEIEQYFSQQRWFK